MRRWNACNKGPHTMFGPFCFTLQAHARSLLPILTREAMESESYDLRPVLPYGCNRRCLTLSFVRTFAEKGLAGELS